jgi:hypothetical protein
MILSPLSAGAGAKQSLLDFSDDYPLSSLVNTTATVQGGGRNIWLTLLFYDNTKNEMRSISCE